jgi:hypothetical protein
LNDKSIDAESRAIIRYGLEVNDPWLAELVPRAGAGQRIADIFDFSQTTHAYDNGPSDDGPSERKIEVLAEIICRAGDEAAGALFVLMGTLQHSGQPEVLAYAAKHLALRLSALQPLAEYTLCGMNSASLALDWTLFRKSMTCEAGGITARMTRWEP